MLQLQAVKPDLLLNTKRFFSLPWASGFLLVGGTNVALQIGHRLSVDIDLFTNTIFVPGELLSKVERDFSIERNRVVIDESGLVLFLKPGDIKVDLFHVDLEMKLPPIIEDGMRLANLMDVAAMKMEAMVQRREKKDYIDLHFIFKKLDPLKCLEHFHQVDRYCSPKSVAFALTEVESAVKNKSEMPTMLMPVDWNEIENEFRSLARMYAKGIGLNIDANGDGQS
jgi:Nucleotidyl transferase AbiEii toxin, Type IV TA system